MRYCIVSDSSGHRYICPVEREKEVLDSIEAVEAYWEEACYDGDCPEDLTDGLPSWEGEELTFENPQLDGKPLNS